MTYKHDMNVLLAVIASNKTRGHGPSGVEIARVIGVHGQSTVQRSLSRLRAAGLITLGYAFERGGIRPTAAGLSRAGVFPAEERVESLDLGA